MMERSKGSAMPWWGWLAWILTVVLEAFAFPHLPPRVATHFDAAGQANGYSSRWGAMLILPVIMIGCILFWYVFWRIDPKKRNYETFWPTYRYIGGVVVVFIGLVQLWTLGHALNLSWVSARLLPTIFGILIMLFSNVLPRVQPNWIIGIRTPWTLSSDISWQRTHRLAGHRGYPLAY